MFLQPLFLYTSTTLCTYVDYIEVTTVMLRGEYVRDFQAGNLHTTVCQRQWLCFSNQPFQHFWFLL